MLALSASSLPSQALTHVAQAPDTTSIDFNPVDLLAIFNPAAQVCMVPRPANPNITAFLRQEASQLAPGARMLLDARHGRVKELRAQIDTQLARVLPKMRTQAGQALCADMAQIAAIYADLLGCPQIGLRLEVVSQAMCPKFHVDRTGIRLVCTYLGPGTQWLNESSVHRHALTQAHASIDAFHQALIPNAQAIQQAPAFALVCLKGSLWQDNSIGGAVHRSPPVSADSWRVVVAFDAIW